MPKSSALPTDGSPSLTDFLLGYDPETGQTDKQTIENVLRLMWSGSNSSRNPYKFRAYLNSAQNTGSPVDTYSPIVFNAENFDTSNNFDTASGGFTAPIAGFYQFNWTINVTIAGPDTFEAALFINSALYSRGFRSAINTVLVGFTGSDFVQLAAGDIVKVDASSTTARAISTGASNTFFSGFLVAAT